MAGVALDHRVAIAAMTRADRIDRTRRVMLAPTTVLGGAFEPVWTGEGAALLYLDPARPTTVLRVDLATGERSEAFDVAALRERLRQEFSVDVPGVDLPFQRFELVADGMIRFQVRRRWFDATLADLVLTEVTEDVRRAATSVPTPWPAAARSIRPAKMTGLYPAIGIGPQVTSPDGRWVLTAPAGRLTVTSTLDGRGQAVVTSPARTGYMTSSAAWAPNAQQVAAVNVDTQGMADVPIVHWLKPIEEIEFLPYVKSGGRTATSRIDVVDIASGEVVPVCIPAEDGLRLHVVGWRRGGREVLALSLNREGDVLRLYSADPRTGDVTLLIEETHEFFFEGLSVGWHVPGFEAAPFDGNRIVWASERDGWRHLHLHDGDGKLLHRLTEGSREVSHVVAVDEANGALFYAVRSDRDRPMDVHVHRVGLDGTGDRRITSGAGQHAMVVSPDATALLDRHSSIDRPDTVTLLHADGTEVAVLSQAPSDALSRRGWCVPEEFTAVAADGTTPLHGLIYHPPSFDPSGLYPVVEHIYAGPYRSNVGRTFADAKHALAQVMADAGFVSVVVDGRGTPERGAAFQGVVHRRFGQHEILDHGGVIEQLVADRAYLDPDRVGIMGGSWGGYFTIRALLQRPDLYRVGVALYPAVDLHDHNALAIEQYMKLPVNNPDGYEAADNLKLADRLEGKLLLIHGTSDVNATFSTTVKLVEALTRASKPYDLVIMPEQAHDLSGHTGQYAVAALVDYFAEHL